MHNRHGGFTIHGIHARPGKQRITRAALALLALMGLLVLAPGFTSAQTSSSGALRSLVTTGAIGTNSNALTVANAAGFQVGDWVIVEIGKEPGKGMRGTRGVGGTWPSRSFPTVQAMNATGGSPGQFVWVESTGVVYERIGNQWRVPSPPAYYTAKALPQSLQARITAVKGNTLTLDKSAVLGVSGANVYLDVAPVINKMIVDAPNSVTMPAGNFAIGGPLWILNKPGFTFAGRGKSQTKFYSPKGVPSAQLEVNTSPNSITKDFTIQGNWGDNGFGLNWIGSTPPASFTPVNDVALPQGSQWPRAINVTMSSHRSIVQDIEVIDTAQMAVMATFSDEIWAYRVSNIQNEPMRQYLQWQFQWVHTTGGGCVDCSIVSSKLISGFEAFMSKNVSFIRPRGVNATFAANGAGGWLLQDAELRFTANNLDFEQAVNNAAAAYPILNINNNANFPNHVALGGTVRNLKIVQEGHANAAGETLTGIMIQKRMSNIRIEGGTFTAPDFSAGKGGAAAINAWGAGTYVANFRVTGLPNPSAPHNNANIYVQGPCIVNGGGNSPDPRASSSMYFNATPAPAEGCITPTSKPVIEIGSREPAGSGGAPSGNTGANTPPPVTTPSTPSTGGTTPGTTPSTPSTGGTTPGTTPSTPSTGGTTPGTNPPGGTPPVGTPTPRRGKGPFDFAGAGASTILWRNQQTGENSIWTFGDDLAPRPAFISGAPSSWQIAGSGDFDGDGKDDILWRDANGEVAIWLMNDTTVALSQKVAVIPVSWTIVGTGDFDGDGKTDILWRERNGNIAIWLMDGASAKSSSVIRQLSSDWKAAGVGDLNGDGKADIVWARSDGYIATWLMNGIHVTVNAMLDAGAGWAVAGLADYNGDGKADVIWRNTKTGDNGIWFMDGVKRTSSALFANVPDAQWTIAATGDYDGDGKADMLWRNMSTGDNAIWLMDGATVKDQRSIPAVPDMAWQAVRY